MKLHLGCGNDKKKGYVNCDISPAVKPDRIVDLEKKLLFKDNSIDKIVANYVLKYITKLYPLMEEFQKICKNKSIIKIKVPFYLSVGAFMAPTHVRFFTPFTMDYFCDSHYNYEVAEKPLFKLKKVRLKYTFTRKVNKLVDPIINLNHNVYCKFFAGLFLCSEIYCELEVIKKNEK